MMSIVSNYTRAAIRADAAFQAALDAVGMDRWETPKEEWTSEIMDLYHKKVQADERVHQAWTMWRV